MTTNITATTDRAIHARLVRGMARRVGGDMAETQIDGRLQDVSLKVLIEKCRLCRNVGACMAWQADHTFGAAAAPDYCLNRDQFFGR